MLLQNDDRWFRVGAGAVAVLAGIVLGFCAGMLAPRHFPAAFFGAAIAGALTGAVFPEAGLRLGEGTIHFLAGALTAAQWTSGDDVEGLERSGRDSPKWLQAAFCFGFAYAFFWWALVYV
jgi:hypothetical protein